MDGTARAAGVDYERKAEVAFREATRHLEIQERAFDSIRTRATIVFSGALLLVGFATTSTASTPGRNTGWWGTVAVAVLAVGCAIGATWRAQPALGAVAPTVLSVWVKPGGITYAAMLVDLAGKAEDARRKNQDSLRRRAVLLQTGFVLLGIELVAGAVAAGMV
ncbi:MAG: hypothetical protein U0Q07_01685 [Acidimicrobiales bacterium]